MAEGTAAVRTQTPDREEIVARAAALTPVLAARAEHVEKTRTIHPDTVRDFWDTDLWIALKPKRYGGLQLDFRVFIDVSDHLARGCASTAWIYGNLLSHDWMLPMWNPRAQDEVWKDNPRALMSSSLVATAGVAKPVEGGYEITGQWPYCSGLDPSDWLLMSAMIDDGGPRRPIWFAARRDAFEEIDTWHVSGLIGTGSRDIKCKGAFIPEHMTLDPKHGRGGPTPGTDHVDDTLYKLPVLGLFPYVLAGVMIGIAQGAYDDYVSEIRTRTSTYNASKLAEHVQIQMKVAEAGALIRSARFLCYEAIREAEEVIEAGQIPTVPQKVAWRRDGAFAAQNCVKALSLLHSAIGAAGMYLSHPFQRRLRDMNMAATQIQVNFDINGAEFGRVELGLDPINKGI